MLLTHTLVTSAMACRFKVTGWLAKKYKTPREAEAHYCEPDRSSVNIKNSCASVHKTTASASVQTDDVDVSVLITHLFTTLPVTDQLNLLSKLFPVYMLNNCCIDVPEDFLSCASNAMSRLRHGQRINVLYNLAKGIGTL